MSPPVESSAAVVVDRLHKKFVIPDQQVNTLKERVLHPLRGTGGTSLVAFDELSFQVGRGEFFGIVGRNGSGKSTLLKCLAGIYRADRGDVYVDGRVSTFIELGVGFNPDLAARDNIRLNAVLLGLSPRDARAREDAIIAFAGLEPFIGLKIKNYSSGMLVRLAFAVMVHVDADVLLIDEVLAVGDAAFQQRCYDEFHRIRDEGRTVLFVTHDMSAVERFCHRAMLLDGGRMVAIGDPHGVARRYLEVNFAGSAARARPRHEDPNRAGDGRAEIVEAWFEAEDGSREDALPHGAACAFAARVRFAEDVEDPIFGFVLHNGAGQTVLAASTNSGLERTGQFVAGEEITYRVRFGNVFSPDRYFATPAVAHHGQGIAWIDRRERFVTCVVTGTNQTDAIVDLPYDVAIDRTAEPSL